MRRVLVLVAGAALLLPSTASAHLRTSRSAVDYRAFALPVQAPLHVRIYPSDLAVGLTLVGRGRVVVLGYVGEPFLRLEPDGVFVNAASPTAAGAKLTPAHTGSRQALWERRSRRPAVIWHDARVRGLPAGVSSGTWRIPLLVDGRNSRLEGTIQRVDPPAGWPWVALGAAFVAAAAFTLLRRSLLHRAAAWLGAIAAGAALVSVAGFALSSGASQGAWVEGANEAVVAVVGALFLVWGSSDAKAIAGGVLGLLGLSAGLTRLPVLLHGIVLSALPGVLARVAVVVAISAGAAAATLGLVVFFQALKHYEEPEVIERYL
jgi:hypothetical protein